MEFDQEEMNLLRKQLSISMNRVEMLVTNSSTAEQEEKQEERGSCQTLVAMVDMGRYKLRDIV